MDPGHRNLPGRRAVLPVGQGSSVDCVAGNVRAARVRPLEPFVLGETYEAVVNPLIAPSLVVDRARTPSRPPPRGSRRQPRSRTTAPGSPTRGARLQGSRQGRSLRGRAPGRRYRLVCVRGRIGHLVHGSGAGPGQGGDLDRRRSARHVRCVRGADRLRGWPTFDGLGAGSHTITIRVLGRARASATDTQVVVDAFRAGGKLVSNPDLQATWGAVERGGASGGSLGTSDLARSSAEVTFRGTGIEWITYRGADQGRAEVYVDGLRVRTVDNYAPAPTFDVARSFTGLPEGVHTPDRGAWDRPGRGQGRAGVDRPLLDRPVTPTLQAPAARAMRSAASFGSRTSVFKTRS